MDERLKDEDWRKRVGFDNIDPRPWRPLESTRRKLMPERIPISTRIDQELFGKGRR